MSEAAAADVVPPGRRLLITAAVVLATLMYSLDWTIASVALPHMRGTFSATPDQISWVITSYIVASAVMIPTAGSLSRRYGRRRMYLIAVAGFTASSVLCAIADSLAAEVVYRILQGMSGAYLVPMSQAILLDTYPREEHGKATAMWSVGVMLGPIMGPTVGGYLTELYSWRWIFYINVPVGILAFLGTLAFVPETRIDKGRRFDWMGFLSLAIGIGALQMMLDRGERFHWFESPEIVLEAAAAALGLYLFAAHSLTTRTPFLHLGLLRDRNYAVGLTFIFLYGLLTLVPMVLLPPMPQELLDYPIDTVGLLQSPRGIGLMVAAIAAGQLSGRVDPKLMIGFGLACLAGSAWAMSGWNLDVGAWEVVWTGFLQGLGGGALIVPLGVLTFATLDPEYRTEAASLFNLVRSVGSSIGVSLAFTVLTRTTTISRSGLVEHVSPFNERFAIAADLERWNPATQQGLAAIDAEVARQAIMVGYVNDFHLLAIACLAGLPLLLLLRKPKPAPAHL